MEVSVDGEGEVVALEGDEDDAVFGEMGADGARRDDGDGGDAGRLRLTVGDGTDVAETTGCGELGEVGLADDAAAVEDERRACRDGVKREDEARGVGAGNEGLRVPSLVVYFIQSDDLPSW